MGLTVVYVKTKNNDQGNLDFLILAVYVDDIIPVSNNTEMLNAEKKSLCKRFEMVDNGEAEFILGMVITHFFFISNSIFELSLELLTTFAKMRLKVA